MYDLYKKMWPPLYIRVPIKRVGGHRAAIYDAVLHTTRKDVRRATPPHKCAQHATTVRFASPPDTHVLRYKYIAKARTIQSTTSSI